MLIIATGQAKDILVEENKDQKLIPLVQSVKVNQQEESIPAVKLTPAEPVEEPPKTGIINIRFGTVMSMIPQLLNKLSSSINNNPFALRSPETFAANEELIQQNSNNMKFTGGEEAKLNQLSLDKMKLAGGEEANINSYQHKKLLGGDHDNWQQAQQEHKKKLLGGDEDKWRCPHHAMLGGEDDPDH